MGHEEVVHDICPRKVTLHPRTEALRVPNTNKWIVSLAQSTRLTLDCLGTTSSSPLATTETKEMSGLLLISPPPRCSIRGSDFELPYYFSRSTHVYVQWSNYSKVEQLPMITDLFSAADRPLLSATLKPSPGDGLR
jgi:hypothetical protein